MDRLKPTTITILSQAIDMLSNMEKKSAETTLALRSVEIARFWLQEDMRKNEQQ